MKFYHILKIKLYLLLAIGYLVEGETTINCKSHEIDHYL